MSHSVYAICEHQTEQTTVCLAHSQPNIGLSSYIDFETVAFPHLRCIDNLETKILGGIILHLPFYYQYLPFC